MEVMTTYKTCLIDIIEVHSVCETAAEKKTVKGLNNY